MSAREPEDVARELKRIAKLASKLSVEYALVYEYGYVGFRSNSFDDIVQGVGASDPTGAIVVSNSLSSVRADTQAAERYVAQAAHFLGLAAHKLLMVANNG